jgi:class 3 adenylate cyclase
MPEPRPSPRSQFRLCALALALFALALDAGAQGAARGGGLSLRGQEFGARDLYALDGQWQFWWGSFVDPDSLARNDAPPPTALAEMPSYWTKFELEGRKLPARGAATYRIVLSLPEDKVYGLYVNQMVSSYALYLNGRLLGGNGSVALDPDEVRPEFRPQVLYFTAEEGTADIVLHIANGDYRHGGQWQAIELGSAEAVSAHANRIIMTELFLFGAIAMIGLYNIALFLFRTKDRSPLWFGLFCLFVALRLAATGHVVLASVIRGFPWELLIKIELSVFYLGALFFAFFFRSLYPKELSKYGFIPMISVYGLFTALALVLPVSLFNHLVVPMQLGAVGGLSYVLICLVLASFRKREHAPFILAGFAFFALTAVNDILYAHAIIHTAYLVPLGLFTFIFSQAVALARIFSRSFSQVEHLSERLSSVNISLERFVPHEFLSFLDKSSIIDVHLGDQALKDLTILFSDIRSFTTLSESMTPQENFNFLNSYLERVGPIIRDHGGFIDKYIGDAIMALFPRCPEDALDASIAIQNTVRTYNEERVGWGHRPIQVGIGLNTGPAMLGIIGERMRLESTVISDTVNLASRIENLTKFYRTDVLVSGELVRKLGEEPAYDFRLIDRVTVKGKSAACDLYELISSHAEADRSLLLASRDAFLAAARLFKAKNYSGAAEAFRRLCAKNPSDQVSRVYLGRCEKAMAGAGTQPIVVSLDSSIGTCT